MVLGRSADGDGTGAALVECAGAVCAQDEGGVLDEYAIGGEGITLGERAGLGAGEREGAGELIAQEQVALELDGSPVQENPVGLTA